LSKKDKNLKRTGTRFDVEEGGMSGNSTDFERTFLKGGGRKERMERVEGKEQVRIEESSSNH